MRLQRTTTMRPEPKQVYTKEEKITVWAIVIIFFALMFVH